MMIRNNIAAMTAYRNYLNISTQLARSVERLSSGYRINRAADDPAGLAISEKMRAQIRGLNMASRNCQDAVSLVQTAEGALQQTHAILQRMREIAVQSASDTNETRIDRAALNQEYQQLLSEINDIARVANFNEIPLLNGTADLTIQSGPNQGDELKITIGAMTAEGIGIAGTSVADRKSASEAIGAADDAIKAVASQRAYLGAMHNRLEHKINNLENTAINLSDAESRIRDVDIAKEMMNFTRLSILQQVALAVMAQANASAWSILRLFDSMPGPRGF